LNSRADLQIAKEDLMDEEEEDEIARDSNTSKSTQSNTYKSYKDNDEDAKAVQEQYEELGLFYQDFANKLLAFDPLDRPVLNS
jgi:hypothetical protein